jgi:ribosomal protein S24E
MIIFIQEIKMNITKQTRNDLLKRQEINFIVEAPKNPSFEEAKKMLAHELKKPEDHITVNSVYGKFGRDTFLVKSYVYDSKEELVKSIQKTQKQRKKKQKQLLKLKKQQMKQKKLQKLLLLKFYNYFRSFNNFIIKNIFINIKYLLL